MATVTWGPYFFTGPIPPRGAKNVVWGPSTQFEAPSTFTVTGHPVTSLRRTNYYLWVSDMSTAKIDVGTGDISNIQCRLYATFFNSGQSGEGTVQQWAAYVTKTTP